MEMAVLEAPDRALTDPPAPEPEAPARASRFRFVLAIVLGVATLAAAGAGIWLTAQRGDAAQTQAGREDAMSAASQFMLRMGTYGPDQLDEKGGLPAYREAVREVITPTFAASFDEQAGAAEALVAQAGVARTTEIFATGVTTIDPDSATALVAGAFTDSYTVKGELRPQDPVPFRIRVELVHEDGTWLVDDFKPVTGSDDTAPTLGGGQP